MPASEPVHRIATRGREVGLATLVAFLVAAVVAAGFAFLASDRARSEQWSFTALLLVAYAAAAGAASCGLARAPLRALTRVAIALLTAALIAWVLIVWLPRSLRSWDAALSTASMWCTVAGLAAMYRMVLLLPRLDAPLARFIRNAVALIGAAAASACALSFTAQAYRRYAISEAIAPWMLWGLLASFVGWVIVQVLAMIEQGERERRSDPTIARSVRTRVVCPRCASEVVLASNRAARCPACRLRLRLVVEEPRCVCGYVLYRLRGDTCPECGRPVPEEDRWAAAREPADTEDPAP